MAEYHVGCGIAGIYAGTLKPNGYEWRNKSEVTNEALDAVTNYLFSNSIEVRFTKDGKKYALRIVEREEEE